MKLAWIGHQTPYWPSTPSPNTHTHTHLPNTTNQFITSKDILKTNVKLFYYHMPQIKSQTQKNGSQIKNDTKIGPISFGTHHRSHILKQHKSYTFYYGGYLGNYCKRHVLKQNISILQPMYITNKLANNLHLLSCCTNRHDKVAMCALANTLLAHPKTRCFTLKNTSKFKEYTPNTVIQYLHGSSHAHATYLNVNV